MKTSVCTVVVLTSPVAMNVSVMMNISSFLPALDVLVCTRCTLIHYITLSLSLSLSLSTSVPLYLEHSVTAASIMITIIMIVLVIERSLVRLPAGALSSQLGQLSFPSLRDR